MSKSEQSRLVYEKLDTAYVNLAALLRYLQKRKFGGRVHVELDAYEADVYLDGQGGLYVHERDQASGREAEGDAAMQRLVVRATAPGGLVSVYQDGDEEMSTDASATTAETLQMSVETEGTESSVPEETTLSGEAEEEEEPDWPVLLRLSGEMIGAVERAVLGVGADFATAFRAARLEMADDFSFLDPSTARFEYANSEVRLHAEPSAKVYLSGVSACLHQMVEKLTKGERGGSMRERIALELAVLARRRQAQLARFNLAPQLDRIAGTRVL
jgi:hypothetical protein